MWLNVDISTRNNFTPVWRQTLKKYFFFSLLCSFFLLYPVFYVELNGPVLVIWSTGVSIYDFVKRFTPQISSSNDWGGGSPWKAWKLVSKKAFGNVMTAGVLWCVNQSQWEREMVQQGSKHNMVSAVGIVFLAHDQSTINVLVNMTGRQLSTVIIHP